MAINIKYVGFWNHVRDPCENIMPWETVWPLMPIADSAQRDQKAIICAIERVQTCARKTGYFGPSPCRLGCERGNGGSEYAIDGFVWPDGYIHYLRDHNVAVDPVFARYVLSFNPELFHDTTFTYKY